MEKPKKVHIAIMNKSLGLIDKIVKKQKTIESRWYVNRINPWNNIEKYDIVYFKESGGLIIAKATVKKVIQIENLDKKKFDLIIKKYAKDICLKTREYTEYYQKKRYVILIFLKDPKYIKPFKINKQGFGNACAWVTTKNIKQVKKLVN